ncbi:hypothetical protein CERZMDRAFT_114711 [Cercospora zeae-maydis SCOH1-5]|uniref:Wax synthase domain-containing protein n=1 Tax=Cercospora zeae-maydis SCOH1-5 TaxID=717836 RepID=A0A6A6F6E8_9PEZI|nr:hypothetical protein CERZMDRAFT_114711 [Cercospora zeae-maydis SCOH1-5]
MLPPGLESPRQVKAYYTSVYNDLIASGAFQPFLYPQATLGFAIVLVYLLIDHRRRTFLAQLRLPIVGLLVAFSAWNILNVRARSAPAAYGVGLISSWGTMWTAAVMAWNDCQTDFRRLERADQAALGKASEDHATDRNAQKIANGRVETQRRARMLELSEVRATQGPAKRTAPIFWQAYPVRPFVERLDWVADVFCSFRGVGWSFQTSGVPGLPKHIELELQRNEDDDVGNTQDTSNSDDASPPTTSYTGLVRFSSRHALLRFLLPRLFLGAAALDIIKTLMHHDPYFWGYTNTTSTPPWLFGTTSPILLRSARLVLSFLGISIALNTIFLLGPLFFVYILSSKVIGLRGTPFLNPPTYFGSISHVLNKGLAGFWSSFWHQTFRYAFQAPATRLLAFLHMEPRSRQGRMVSLWLAFGLSGLLHASGSTTQLGDTRPLRGPFAFFLCQALGITLQTFFTQKTQHRLSHFPRPVRQLGNFSFVIVWMYFTAPLLVDDFARGGVWLYEPLIISPLRVCGWGRADDREDWILWKDLVGWHSGKGWWDSGLAF